MKTRHETHASVNSCCHVPRCENFQGGLCGGQADSALFWMRNTVAAKKSVRYTVFVSLRGCGESEFQQWFTVFHLLCRAFH